MKFVYCYFHNSIIGRDHIVRDVNFLSSLTEPTPSPIISLVSQEFLEPLHNEPHPDWDLTEMFKELQMILKWYQWPWDGPIPTVTCSLSTPLNAQNVHVYTCLKERASNHSVYK